MYKELDEFGKILINDVRDRTIRNIDSIISGKMKDSESQVIYKKISNFGEDEKLLINILIPKIIDFSIHNMLEMFEENEKIELIINGKNLAEISDGLAGELYTEDGWIQKFSEQRYEDI